MARPSRRTVARGAVAVLAAGALGGHAAHDLVPREHPRPLRAGTFRTARSVRRTYTSGDLELSVRTSRLRLTRGGLTLWENEPVSSFLGAVEGRLDVEEHLGYFWPRVSLERTWSDQSLLAVETTPDGFVLTGELANGTRRRPYSVRFAGREGAVRLTASVPGVDAVTLSPGRSDGAGVHGLGEQFLPFDLDGRILPLLTREQGVGRGTQPLSFLADVTNHGAAASATASYAAWPSLLTRDLRGVRVVPGSPGAHAVAIADLTARGRIGLQLWHPSVTVDLTAARTPREIVAAQQADTRRERVAEWTQKGLICAVQGGTDAVRSRVAALQSAGVPVAAVWIQDWPGRRRTSFGDRVWWTWQLDRARYPGWDALVRDLADDGIKVTTYVNPFVVDAAPKGDRRVRNLFAEARKAGHLVRDRNGEPYALDQGGYDAYLVDLTSPAARSWYADVIAQEVLGLGADGFMADFGEGLPFDAALHDGPADQMHNAWPGLWQRTVREACRAAGKPDAVTWFRSGSLGSSPALAWTGDQLVTFDEHDGMESALRGTLSAGVSGWPVVHSDIGGYTSIDAVVKNYTRTPDLLRRWAEFAAFSPVMRTHETNRPADNLQVADDRSVLAHLARMTKVFAALAPYRATLLDEAQRTGLPVMRHGWLVAPGTPAADVDTQYFLGDDVLVVPVLKEGGDPVDVVFPPGAWRHLFTGDVVDGPAERSVDAPAGTPAVFVRASSPWATRLTSAVRSTIG